MNYSETVELDHAWSWTRHRLWRECRRAFLFHYVADGSGEEALRRRQLKELLTWELWADRVIHQTIALVLNDWIISGIPPKRGTLLRRGLARLHRDWEDYSNERWREDPKALNLESRITPDHPYSSQNQYEAARQRVETCLTHPVILETIRQAVHPRAVDQVDSFFLDQLRVWTRIDLAWENNQGNMILVDWRSGRAQSANSRTMQTQALLAIRKWRIPLDRVRLRSIWLQADHPLDEMTVDPGALLELQDLILTSAAEMHLPTRSTDPADYPRTTRTLNCLGCRFQELCER